MLMSCKMIKHFFLVCNFYIIIFSPSSGQDHLQSNMGIIFSPGSFDFGGGGVQFGYHLWSWDHLPTYTIHLGGERHHESKVICPRTLHIDLGQGLSIDCSIQSPVHQPLDWCTFHWNTSM